MKKTIKIKKVCCRVYRFKKPLHFDVKFKKGIWTFTNKELDFISYVETKSYKKALNGMIEDFDILYRHIAEENDNLLSPGAIILKKKLLKLVST